MSLESRIYSFINKYRISPYDFNTSVDESINLQIRNPENSFNPLGNDIADLSLFVMSDTHWHVQNRQSYDRTLILPSTLIMNSIRRHIGGSKDWHQLVRPELYNLALHEWPNKVSNMLREGQIIPTRNALIVHAGDIADDSLNQSEFLEAAVQTSNTLEAISQELIQEWGSNSNIGTVQLLGDHDADYRGWNQENRIKQIQWLFSQLHVAQQSNCFLQEVNTSNGQKLGVLMIDTNMLNSEWISEVEKFVKNGINKNKIMLPMELENLLQNEQVFHELRQTLEELELYNLLSSIVLYKDIFERRHRQFELIQQSQEYKESVVIGHKPKETIEIARLMQGNPIAVCGHRHYTLDTDNSLNPFIKNSSYFGGRVRLLQTGAATMGAGGIEFKSTPSAYLIQIFNDSQDNKKIYQITQ